MNKIIIGTINNDKNMMCARLFWLASCVTRYDTSSMMLYVDILIGYDWIHLAQANLELNLKHKMMAQQEFSFFSFATYLPTYRGMYLPMYIPQMYLPSNAFSPCSHAQIFKT